MVSKVTLPIPGELVTRVFEFLPLQDQASAALVCKDFAYAAAPAMLRSLQEKDKILRERLKPLIDTLSEEGKKAASKKLVIDDLSEYPLGIQLEIIQDCHNTTLTAKIAAILKQSLGLPSSDMDSVAACVLRRRPEDVASNLFEQIYNRRTDPLWGQNYIYKRVECVRALHLIAHAIPDDKSSFSWNYISDQYLRLKDLTNALLTARKILDPERKFETLMNIIRRYSASNNTQNALSVLGEALVAAKEMSDKGKRSQRLVVLGYNYQMLGDLENALVVLKLAFESSIEIEDLSDKCAKLLAISERFQSLDDRHYALVALNEAFFSARSMKCDWGKYHSLMAVMEKYNALSDVQRTIDVLGELLVCIRHLKDKQPRNHRVVYDNQFVYFSKKHQEFGDLTQSLGVAREVKDLDLRLQKISKEYQRIGDLDNALFILKLAYSFIMEIEDPSDKFKSLLTISDRFQSLDDRNHALVALNEAFFSVRSITYGWVKHDSLMAVMKKYNALSDLQSAIDVLGELLVCIRDMKDKESRNLRVVYDNQFVYFSKIYQEFGDLTQSLGVAREIEDLSTRNLRLEKISEEYQCISDLGNALVVAKEISDDAMKDKRFEAISLAYEALDDLANAVVAAIEITGQQEQSLRLQHLSKAYERKGNLDKALSAAKKIKSEEIKNKSVKHLEKRIRFRNTYGSFLEKIRYLRIS